MAKVVATALALLLLLCLATPAAASPDEVERYRKELEQTLLELGRICAEELSLCEV